MSPPVKVVKPADDNYSALHLLLIQIKQQDFAALQLLLVVLIGGGTGSVARWLLSMRFNLLHQVISLGTPTANLIRVFIIGIGFAWLSRMMNIDPVREILITTGSCGGLTTFPTFSTEVVLLLQEGHFGWTLLNVFVNLLGSFAMTALTFWLFSASTAH